MLNEIYEASFADVNIFWVNVDLPLEQPIVFYNENSEESSK